MPDLSYRLSRKADADLERLYEWGIDRFGFDQADHYYDALLARFDEISKTHFFGKLSITYVQDIEDLFVVLIRFTTASKMMAL